jgi:hypothetical protein
LNYTTLLLDKAQEALLNILQSELKESKNLADFSKTLEDFQIIIDLMKKDPIKNERKMPIKPGVGYKTCRLKNKKNVKNA